MQTTARKYWLAIGGKNFSFESSSERAKAIRIVRAAGSNFHSTWHTDKKVKPKKKKKEAYILTIEYSIKKYFADGTELESAFSQAAKKLGGSETGSGAGMGIRDISFVLHDEKNIAKFKRAAKKILKSASISYYKV